MTTQTIYAYTNISRDTIMVAENDLNFTGTWSSSGTYWAEAKDTVGYGNGLFVALVDNINVNPTFIPKKGQRKWSELAVIRAGTQTDDHTVDQAYALADRALGQANFSVEIAVNGTNAAAAANALAYTALRTAWSGTNGVDQAIQIAVNGTNAAAAGISAASAAAAAAQSTANSAQSAASTAQSAADAAQSSASAAQVSANAAQVSANGAQTAANAAQATGSAALVVAWAGTAAAAVNAHERVGCSYVIDGAGAEIVQGFKGFVEIPFAMWVTGWTIVAEQAGSCVVDIVKSNGYAGFPTTVSIVDNDRPTLNNTQKNQNTNPSAWVRAIGQGDLLGFTVLGAGTVQSVTVALSGTRS